MGTGGMACIGIGSSLPVKLHSFGRHIMPCQQCVCPSSNVCAAPAGPLPECPRQESCSLPSSASTSGISDWGITALGHESSTADGRGKTLKRITLQGGELGEQSEAELRVRLKALCNSLRYQIL